MFNLQITPMRTAPNEPQASKATVAQPPTPTTDPAGFASLLRQTYTARAPLPSPQPRTPAHALPTPLPPVDPDATPAMPAAQANPTTHAQMPAAPGSPGRRVEADTDAANTTTTAIATADDLPAEADPAGSLQARLAARPDGAGKAAPRGAKSDARPDLNADPKADPKADAAEPRAGSDISIGTADVVATATPTSGTVPIDPSLMQWLISPLRPAVLPADASRAKGADDLPAMSAQTGTDGASAASDPLPGFTDATPQVDATLSSKAGQEKAAPGTVREAGDLAAALTDQRSIEPSRPRETKPLNGFTEVNAIASFATAAAAWTPSIAGGPGAPPPVAVALATHVNAPEFAHSLGVQMSVLAKGGVQHAELHLNPADMGPVSVRIVMDGTQARVDFGADVAATRQAIEAGLPALASALRDAGFTLTGGGVSQHSRGRSEGGASDAHPRTRRTEAVDADGAPGGARREVRTTVKMGGLDLYA